MLLLLLVLLNTISAFSESLFYEGKFLNAIDGGEKIVFLKTDGTKLYELRTDADYIYQYSLSTAFASLNGNYFTNNILRQNNGWEVTSLIETYKGYWLRTKVVSEENKMLYTPGNYYFD